MTRPSTNRAAPQPTASEPLGATSERTSRSSSSDGQKRPLWLRVFRFCSWLFAVLLLPALCGLGWLMLVPPSGNRANTGLMHPYFRCPCPVILAHQGASGHAPSNTIESFRLAKRMGADILELDVHQTSDGVLVVSHDATIDRMTNGHGKIKSLTWQQLQTFDAGFRFSRDGKRFPFRGKGIRIPSLAQVFRTFPKRRINIEIKQTKPPIARALWQEIERHHAQDRVLVASFATGPLQAFRRHAKGRVPTGASVRQAMRFLAFWRFGLGGLWKSNIDVLQLPFLPGQQPGAFVTGASVIQAAKHAKRHVHAWTVNTSSGMRQLLKRNIDGIITDFPDRARRAMIAAKVRSVSSFSQR